MNKKICLSKLTNGKKNLKLAQPVVVVSTTTRIVFIFYNTQCNKFIFRDIQINLYILYLRYYIIQFIRDEIKYFKYDLQFYYNMTK